MSDSDEKQILLDRFGVQYRNIDSTVLRDIEWASCGCDYGGTSWTTESEAREIAGRLALAPDRRLLEIGAGSGWPGLYMVKLTGCSAVLLDLPNDGLRAALARSKVDQTSHLCRYVAASGAELPFDGAQFDAIHHADVLCCMLAKLEALKACRAVVQPDGAMVFTVLYVAPGLTQAEEDEATDSGPPFIASEQSYPEMLNATGWEIHHQRDLTENYGATLRTWLAEESNRAEDLTKVIGEAEFQGRRERKKRSIQAIDDGLVRRALYVARPAQM